MLAQPDVAPAKILKQVLSWGLGVVPHGDASEAAGVTPPSDNWLSSYFNLCFFDVIYLDAFISSPKKL